MSYTDSISIHVKRNKETNDPAEISVKDGHDCIEGVFFDIEKLLLYLEVRLPQLIDEGV